ncbi:MULTISPECIES: hypothetical protein [Bacillus]|uniref:Response regulator aspartate phosphatase F n=2 Tax=Bacillus cereus group TaxID=86661 RepID=A0A9X7AVR4_BACTU|nr:MULTISPECIES: hypothetical protein [Bacillus]ALC51997.1 histidine kinase [Bacillus cereus]ASZ67262.1 hypothetical protein CJ306_19010 [Bacillus cereus]EJR96576.1 hypothetical protein IKG_03358 [Bacillus cereus VD200]MBG9617528.1 histidine kinase [Bacillus cereus]MBG9715039.1 histidine kinase [Bacillus cereus]
MNVQLQGNEQITKLFNDWYRAMLQHQTTHATKIKKDIENIISNSEEDTNLQLYYSLFNFRYKILTDGLNINKDDFNKIDSFPLPENGLFSYYYHFFKAIHNTIIGNYNAAKHLFENAKKLLIHVPDELENAEFNYRLASYYYQTYQPLVAIQSANEAKAIFSKHINCEINVALCDNIFGLSCIDLKQFEQAEIRLDSALNILQKYSEETLSLRVRHNLAWLYASQNLSELAMRHISEVTTKQPNHFKALFVEAREYYKLGEYTQAKELIKKGLNISNKLENKEFQYRFMILRELNNKTSINDLEMIILEGISYFKTENLWECIQEYTDVLANMFYEKEDHIKASQYFYMANQARKKHEEKGALI